MNCFFVEDAIPYILIFSALLSLAVGLYDDGGWLALSAMLLASAVMSLAGARIYAVGAATLCATVISEVTYHFRKKKRQENNESTDTENRE